jgi:phosphonate transport system substrate-binding protein
MTTPNDWAVPWRSVRPPGVIRFRRLGRVGLLLFLALTLAALARPLSARADQKSSSAVERHRTIIVGRVTDDPKRHYPALEKIADYLTKRLGDAGIVAGRVVIAKDVDRMTRLLEDGKVDILSETPFSAIQFADRVGAELLAHEWKKGVAFYRTVFYTRREGGVTSLADLR